MNLSRCTLLTLCFLGFGTGSRLSADVADESIEPGLLPPLLAPTEEVISSDLRIEAFGVTGRAIKGIFVVIVYRF